MAEYRASLRSNTFSMQNDIEFQSKLNNNLDILIVVFFSASWCDVCKNLIPELTTLTQLKPLNIYIYADIETCPVVSKKYDINSVPAFLLFHNKILLLKFESKSIDTISSFIDSISSKLNLSTNNLLGIPNIPGFLNLSGLYNKSSIECLNDTLNHPCENLLSPDDSYTESDCDDQLLLTLAFNQNVKVHNLCFRIVDVPSAPKVLKLFINLPNSPDFSYSNTNIAIQTIELTEQDFLPGSSTPLNFVKFQNVSSISLFIMSNQQMRNTTKIKFIGCFGLVKDSPNMNEFKRISGKSGESH